MIEAHFRFELFEKNSISTFRNLRHNPSHLRELRSSIAVAHFRSVSTRSLTSVSSSASAFSSYMSILSPFGW